MGSAGLKAAIVKIHYIAKRTLDLGGALLALFIFSPLMVLIGILIKLDSPGPVLFKQKRLGRGGEYFYILKYRTMLKMPRSLRELQTAGVSSLEPDWVKYQKLYNDPRVTWAGRILRRMSLDELPQVWNVLRGEMSLVGPRPILVEQRILYGDDYYNYIQVRPGMTGLWQVSGRNKLSFSERVSWDQRYIQTWSFGLDLRILARTVFTVIRGEGAFKSTPF
jgi:lipopolysaccharide/colanic/teichoic acid biosynthesis glycosyltransferase